MRSDVDTKAQRELRLASTTKVCTGQDVPHEYEKVLQARIMSFVLNLAPENDQNVLFFKHEKGLEPANTPLSTIGKLPFAL